MIRLKLFKKNIFSLSKRCFQSLVWWERLVCVGELDGNTAHLLLLQTHHFRDSYIHISPLVTEVTAFHLWLTFL